MTSPAHPPATSEAARDGLPSPQFRRGTMLGLVVVLGLLGWFLLHQFPARFYGMDWLTGEHGNQLYRAQVLGAGGLPYRDVECQYGPLPLYAYAAFARVFGNTVQTGAAFHFCLSLVVVAALFSWLVRAARTRGETLLLAGLLALASLCLTVFYRSPLVLSFGANFEYLSFERLWLIGLAAGWRPLRERTGRDVFRIGLFFFLWQMTKFGGAAFGMAGFFLTDAVHLLLDGSKADRRAWFPFWVKAGVACVAAEALRAGLFYAALSPAMAVRALWPFWVAGTYPYDRLDLWLGPRHFLVTVAPIVVPVVAGLLATGLRRWPKARGWLSARLPEALWFPVLVPLAFYLCGSVNKVGYFGRQWLFFQYAFALVPVLLLLALRFPRSAGLALVGFAYAASAGMFLRTAVVRPSPTMVRIETKVGHVWAERSDPETQIWQAARGWLEARPGAKMIAFSNWLGGGWYAAQQERAPLRNTIFVARMRNAADQDELREQLAHTELLVFLMTGPWKKGTTDDRLLRLRQELSALLPADLGQRILDEYVVAETDPRLDNWLMLRRR
jgi:hypothetical protein